MTDPAGQSPILKTGTGPSRCPPGNGSCPGIRPCTCGRRRWDWSGGRSAGISSGVPDGAREASFSFKSSRSWDSDFPRSPSSRFPVLERSSSSRASRSAVFQPAASPGLSGSHGDGPLHPSVKAPSGPGAYPDPGAASGRPPGICRRPGPLWCRQWHQR